MCGVCLTHADERTTPASVHARVYHASLCTFFLHLLHERGKDILQLLFLLPLLQVPVIREESLGHRLFQKNGPEGNVECPRLLEGAGRRCTGTTGPYARPSDALSDVT